MPREATMKRERERERERESVCERERERAREREGEREREYVWVSGLTTYQRKRCSDANHAKQRYPEGLSQLHVAAPLPPGRPVDDNADIISTGALLVIDAIRALTLVSRE
jgi:hypothetical protein